MSSVSHSSNASQTDKQTDRQTQSDVNREAFTTWWGIITGSRRFKRHNLVNIRFIYMKILDVIAEGMMSLKILK